MKTLSLACDSKEWGHSEYNLFEHETIQLRLSKIQKFAKKCFQSERVQDIFMPLKEATTPFFALMIVNELFRVCNRSSLAIFLIVNKIGEEIFQGIRPFVENHIVTKERLNHLKKKIEASKNPELIRSALAVTVAGTFIAMKLLEWGLSSSIAEYSTGSLVQLYHIGTLLILKEAVVLRAGLTAIMVYKKLSRETG